MRQKIFAITVLVFVVGATFALHYKAIQMPGAQERMLSIVQDTPDYIFYPVWLVVMSPFLLMFYFLTFGHKKWARLATQGSAMNAKKVALSLWRASGKPHNTKDGFCVVRLRHLSWGNNMFTLPVRPGHPDIQKFRELRDGDTIEFEPLEQGMECSLEHELCGFIRIKSVS